MPYPGQFHRLVIIGSLYNDTFNTTLSIVPSALGELGMPAVDTPTLNAVAGVVTAWWSNSTVGQTPLFYAHSKLVSIKLNRIGADGRYVEGYTQEFIYATPVSGTVATGNPPPQLSHVVTLKTALERGRGSKGRMYLPPNSPVLGQGTDGRLSTSTAVQSANAVKYLIQQLNTTYTLIGRVGVASNAGAGRFEHVTQVAAGRVVDTMRSRRSTAIEDYQTVSV